MTVNMHLHTGEKSGVIEFVAQSLGEHIQGGLSLPAPASCCPRQNVGPVFHIS